MQNFAPPPLSVAPLYLWDHDIDKLESSGPVFLAKLILRRFMENLNKFSLILSYLPLKKTRLFKQTNSRIPINQ